MVNPTRSKSYPLAHIAKSNIPQNATSSQEGRLSQYSIKLGDNPIYTKEQFCQLAQAAPGTFTQYYPQITQIAIPPLKSTQFNRGDINGTMQAYYFFEDMTSRQQASVPEILQLHYKNAMSALSARGIEGQCTKMTVEIHQPIAHSLGSLKLRARVNAISNTGISIENSILTPNGSSFEHKSILSTATFDILLPINSNLLQLRED